MYIILYKIKNACMMIVHQDYELQWSMHIKK